MKFICMADASSSASCFLFLPNGVKRAVGWDKLALFRKAADLVRCFCCNRKSVFLSGGGFIGKEGTNPNAWCELGNAVQSNMKHLILSNDFVFLIVPDILYYCVC
mmetsp:Transcript_20783/g.37543  ORF Transcript_20783/g.37543 Transcript_20783/m.37543 type:complete len:105 (-) Transcript_20783:259-573(-)